MNRTRPNHSNKTPFEEAQRPASNKPAAEGKEKEEITKLSVPAYHRVDVAAMSYITISDGWGEIGG